MEVPSFITKQFYIVLDDYFVLATIKFLKQLNLNEPIPFFRDKN